MELEDQSEAEILCSFEPCFTAVQFAHINRFKSCDFEKAETHPIFGLIFFHVPISPIICGKGPTSKGNHHGRDPLTYFALIGGIVSL